MDSKEKDISQSRLYNIHQNQLQNGKRNNNKQKEIIDIFGGIDDLLSNVLESNCNLNQIQINKLHDIIINPDKQKQTKIINKPSPNVEDKGYNTTVTYTFYDEHIIMLKCFNKENVNNILSLLNSQLIKGVLFLMIIIVTIVRLLTIYSLSLNVYYICMTVTCITFMFYIWLWILYANKHAIKLLFQQFVFIFKMFYLILFIVTKIWIHYVANIQPIYFTIAYLMTLGALLLFVMIFDAISVSQTNKILISTLTVGLFSWNTLYLRQLEIYLDEYEMYHKAKITSNNHSVFDDIKISLLPISSNSAWILTIFLLQQVILTIFQPTKALVIKSKTFVKYKNNKEKIPTTKHLKLWRAVCVGFAFCSLIYSILNVLLINKMNGTFIILIVNIFAIVICLWLLIINNIKCIHTATSIWFVFCIIDGLATLMFGLDPNIITGSFMGFGLFSGYLLKLKKMEENNMVSSIKNNMNNQKLKTEEQFDIKLKIDENDNGNTKTVKEIEIRNVKNDNKWTNIDRTESIDIKLKMNENETINEIEMRNVKNDNKWNNIDRTELTDSDNNTQSIILLNYRAESNSL